jgi:8-oxo-dGTP pyrophosphatase MutT (NUDIX family)
MAWKPHVTVSAVAEQDGRFLVVEEIVEGREVINNPAGHLERDESLVDAAVREVREETGWGFAPDHVTGIYLWTSESGRTFLRVNFSGRALDHDPYRQLDEGIVRARWLTRTELDACAPRLRSPMVLRCIDDHLAGKRYPLDVLTHLATGDGLR